MPTKRSSEKLPAAHPPASKFRDAVYQIASVLGATSINEEGTEISVFETQNSNVLSRVKQGHVEVITRNAENFLILSADQVVALANSAHAKAKKTMAELYPNLPSLPDYEGRPRYRPLADTMDHLRSRLKD